MVADHELLARIGRGSYGEVWLARNVFGIHRAVKAVYRKHFKDERPFRREYDGIRRFEPISRSHEGFVDVLQIGQDPALQHFYYVMELGDDARPEPGGAPGGYVPRTLAYELRGGPLPIDDCIRIGLTLSNALHQLHTQGLVHRDVKPSNIIFVGGAPKLADIGLVAEVNESRSYVGTEGFIPPEGPGTPQADVYSLGKVLYEISTGRDRMDYPALPVDLHQHPDPGRLLELDAILRRACEADPKRRYPSAWALHAELLLLDHGGSVRRLHTLEKRLIRFKRVGGLAAAVLLGLGVLTAPLYREWRANLREQERQVATLVAAGVQRMGEGDMAAALAAYVDAWRLDRGDPENEPTHRLRIGSVLRQSPGILGPWDTGHSLNEVWLMPNEELVLAVERLGAAHLVNLHDGASRPLVLGARLYRATFARRHGWLATADQSGVATLWDSRNWTRLLPDLPHASQVNAVDFNPDETLMATAADDGRIRIWNAKSGQLTREWQAHGDVVAHVRFSPDGRFLASASYDEGARIWDSATGLAAGSTMRHSNWVGYVSFSPSGDRLVTAGYDHVARIWEIPSGRQALPDLVHDDAVQSAEFSPDGKLIVTASLDSTVRVWDAESGRPAARNPILRHGDRVMHASFAADGQHIVTATRKGFVTQWRLAPPVDGRSMLVDDAVFSRDGRRTALVHETAIEILDAASRQPFGPGVRLDHAPAEVRLNGSGSLLFVRPAPGNADAVLPAIEAYDVETGGLLRRLPSNLRLAAPTVDSSPAGRWLAAAEGSQVRVWELSAPAEPDRVIPHEQPVRRLRFSRDGQLLATAAADNQVHVFRLADLKPLFPPWKLNGPVSGIEFSPNGRHLAAACQDDEDTSYAAIVTDLETGREVGADRAHRDGIHCLQFSPDGRYLVTAGEDFMARVWHSVSGAAVTPPLRHRHQVFAAAFSPNGRWLATTGADRTARLWDAKTGDPLAPPLPLSEIGVTITFLDDQPRVLIEGKEGSVWIWDSTPTGQLMAELDSLVKSLTGNGEPR
ncbi:MAG: serine/threonine protein kinase [Verrucomicrobia bacterium]|nr:serine/threonine protein kinase [Verrucomicrobiota bacterium]